MQCLFRPNTWFECYYRNDDYEILLSEATAAAVPEGSQPAAVPKQSASRSSIKRSATRFAVHGAPEELVGASFNPKSLAPTVRGQHFKSTPTSVLLANHLSRF